MDTETSLLLGGELEAMDESLDNYALAAFRLACVIQDRVDPAETEPHRLAAVLLELFEGSGVPRHDVDEMVVATAIENLSSCMRSRLGWQDEAATEFDAPIPTLPPELLAKVIKAGRRLLSRRAPSDPAHRVAHDLECISECVETFMATSERTPAGTPLSITQLLSRTVEARLLPDAHAELLDASGTPLATTTEAFAAALLPPKL